jgi:hypothetical protein
MAVGAEFTRRRTLCGREWVEISSIWPSVPNSQDDARTVGENGGNKFNKAVGAEFTRRRTSCGREWVEISST